MKHHSVCQTKRDGARAHLIKQRPVTDKPKAEWKTDFARSFEKGGVIFLRAKARNHGDDGAGSILARRSPLTIVGDAIENSDNAIRRCDVISQGETAIEFGDSDRHAAELACKPFGSEHNGFADCRNTLGETPAMGGKDTGHAVSRRGDSGEKAGFGGVSMNQVGREPANGPRKFEGRPEVDKWVQGHDQMLERNHGYAQAPCLVDQESMLFGC